MIRIAITEAALLANWVRGGRALILAIFDWAAKCIRLIPKSRSGVAVGQILSDGDHAPSPLESLRKAHVHGRRRFPVCRCPVRRRHHD
jgi:hypothetical protein